MSLCRYVASLNQAYWRIAIHFVFIFQRSFDCGRYCDCGQRKLQSRSLDNTGGGDN